MTNGVSPQHVQIQTTRLIFDPLLGRPNDFFLKFRNLLHFWDRAPALCGIHSVEFQNLVSFDVAKRKN